MWIGGEKSGEDGTEVGRGVADREGQIRTEWGSRNGGRGDYCHILSITLPENATLPMGDVQQPLFPCGNLVRIGLPI